MGSNTLCTVSRNISLALGATPLALSFNISHALVATGGRPPTLSNHDVIQNRLLERTTPSTKIYADGNKARAEL
jgi:hypothetical protein